MGVPSNSSCCEVTVAPSEVKSWEPTTSPNLAWVERVVVPSGSSAPEPEMVNGSLPLMRQPVLTVSSAASTLMLDVAETESSLVVIVVIPFVSVSVMFGAPLSELLNIWKRALFVAAVELTAVFAAATNAAVFAGERFSTRLSTALITFFSATDTGDQPSPRTPAAFDCPHPRSLGLRS